MRWPRGLLWGAAPLPLVVLAASHLGWVAPARPWREATGWRRLAPEERPGEGAWRAAGLDPELRLTWLGHSGFLVEWAGSRLLLDPNTSRWCTLSRRRMEDGPAVASLGRIDAALVSHAHFDHLDLPTLAAVPELAAVVVPRGTEGDVAELAAAGTAVVGLDVGSVARFGGLEVTAVAAAHNGGRLHPLASRRPALGYVVRGSTMSLYYAGDTGFRLDFDEIARRHRPRLAILPIGAYAPAWPLRRYHLSPEEAVAAAGRLGVAAVVPCHFGTFALSLDRPDAALPRFARAARRRGLAWVMPRPGEAVGGAPGEGT